MGRILSAARRREARGVDRGLYCACVPVPAPARLCPPLSARVSCSAWSASFVTTRRSRWPRRSCCSTPIDDLTRGVTRREAAPVRRRCCSAIGVVGGVFRFLTRRILIGASRDIEYDMRNDFFAHLRDAAARLLPGAPDRRPDVARDQRSERRAHDDRPVGDVFGEHAPDVRRGAGDDGGDRRAADAARRSFRCRSCRSRCRYFGSAIHKRFEQIQAQLSEVSAVAQEALSGVRVVRAYRQEAAEIERFQRAERGVLLRRNRRLIVAAGVLLPEHVVLPRPRRDAGAVARQPRGDRRPDHARPVRRVQRLPDDAGWPMIAFGWVTNMLQRGMASWKRMLEVLDTEPAIQDRPRTRRVAEHAGHRRIARNHRLCALAISDSRRHRIPRSHVLVRRRRRCCSHVSARIAAGQTVGDRRRHRIRASRR